EGAPALLDSRPQQGALIRVEEKRGQIRGRRLGRDRAIGLGLGNDRGDVRRPRQIKVCQAFADQLALVCEFGAEIAEEASAAEMCAGVSLVQPLEMSAQPLQRGEGRIGEGRATRIVAAIAVDHLGAERFLALKVIVEGALRHPGGSRNVLHATAIKALLNQDLKPGADDLLSYVWSSHSRSI